MKHTNNSLVTTPQIAPALNGLHRCPCTGKGDAQEASVFWNEAPQLILFLCEWTGCQGDAPALLSPVLAGTWSFSKTLVQCYSVPLDSSASRTKRWKKPFFIHHPAASILLQQQRRNQERWEKQCQETHWSKQICTIYLQKNYTSCSKEKWNDCLDMC